MRWVTYLSPSGGTERPGVVDDGCVFGYPGGQSVGELLTESAGTLADAHQRALAEPVEIIVEFEARLCAPLRPWGPIPALLAEAPMSVDPAQVRGTDEGALLPPGAGTLSAAVGLAAVFGDQDRHAGYVPACLWRAPDDTPAGLSLGPAVVTPEELDGSELTVTATVEDTTVAVATVDGKLAWARGLGRAGGASGATVVATLPAATRPLKPGEELLVDGGPLGEFEIRVGSAA